ncbi:MAG: type II toxin-antitoxin system RelE/ParE family toxin [Desulfobacterales bacterium]
MSYQILFKRSAAKALKKFQKLNKNVSPTKLIAWRITLPNPDTTKMKGDNPFHRVRVGNYRIIYEIQDDVLIIMVVKIGHRKDIYRNIP